ncbi:MAG: site-2 protease family protein [Clostridia bacterium]|nr:site-2 protease family protein [Clostridia bacterium]
MSDIFYRILNIILTVLAAVISITVHEVSHGLMAYKCGDNTAKVYGRLSFNPLKHIDWIGAICLVLFKFGWAKPVPVNQYNFNNRKKGIILVSLAGPCSNFIMAFIAMLLVAIIPVTGMVTSIAATFFWMLLYLNIGLGIFNLIPIPPLDGSKILAEFLKGGAKYRYLSIERYGSVILLLVFAIRPLNNIFSSFLGFFQGLVLSGFSTVIEFILGVF